MEAGPVPPAVAAGRPHRGRRSCARARRARAAGSGRTVTTRRRVPRRRVPLQRAADGGARRDRAVARRRHDRHAAAAGRGTGRLRRHGRRRDLQLSAGAAGAHGPCPGGGVRTPSGIGHGAADADGRVRHRARHPRRPVARERAGASSDNPFLIRAISLVVDGVPAADVRHTLKTFSQVREEADAECALVLEAAGGYAPTLGILGAVLGLIQAMEHLTSPASVGPGHRRRVCRHRLRRRRRESGVPAAGDAPAQSRPRRPRSAAKS